MPDVAIQDVLLDCGLSTPEAQARGRAVLEAAGLTNARKQRLSEAKLEAARQLLLSSLARCCGHPECRAALAACGREVVVVEAVHCEVCGGSDTRRAVGTMVSALQRGRVRRLLVVGGSPNAHRELTEQLEGSGIELRLVDGSGRRHTRADAVGNLEWADLVVVWGTTILDHKVSALYTAPGRGTPLVPVFRRGVASLAQAVVTHLQNR